MSSHEPRDVGVPRMLPLGDCALLIELGDAVAGGRVARGELDVGAPGHDHAGGDDLRHRLLAIAESIEAARLPGVIDIVPALTGLAVHYDPAARPAAADASQRELEPLITAAHAPVRDSRLVEIPVLYGGEHGRDLEYVARYTGLDAADVVRRHAAAEYVVSMIGFVPGFPYLGGLPPELATPRLDTPRKLVPAGSVAIGGDQAGIYPLDSAGGWRIIGWTGTRLFDPHADEPALLRAGDRVRFIATSR
jgi:5-oxoprolinase (ATP-hydrolysing) subunit B